MDNQSLELKIKSTAQEAVSSVDILVKRLTNVDNVLTNIYLELGRIEKKSTSSMNNVKSSTENVVKTTDKATISANKLGKALSLTSAYLGVKRLASTMLNWMYDSIDYTEQLNLFNVVFKNIEKDGKQTFSTLGQEATKFQNKLNEAFGTNKIETLKYQALFESMGENVGIPDKYASLMSETMTKFTYDLASLYNKSESTTGEALRAGVYAGQTKPLRSFGIDVTQTSMQPILDELGIDKTVKELSQAEKEILRYITTLRQGSVAMGDFANTIDSPSNQLKIFKQQLTDARVALTSLFIGGFSKLLPYANAILMVIKEVSKAIAGMFGIKLTDYNNGIASVGSDFEDVGNNAGNASKKVKELKRQVLGFDQINNINEDKDNSGGSGSSGGVSGGIDQRLLDAIKGYDNGMEKVKMKATEIRDRIMEWLGFTKHINAETGEVYFTLDNQNSTMYKIVEALKKIVKYGKEAIKGVFKVLKNDFDNGAFGKIIVSTFNLIANSLEYIAKHKGAQKTIARTLELLLGFKVVKGILTPIINTTKNMASVFGTASTNVASFLLKMKGIDVTSKSGNKAIEALSGKITKFVSGLGLAIGGLTSLGISMTILCEKGTSLSSVLGVVGSSLASIAGGAIVGSVFGPMGTAIGACVGALGALTVAIGTYKTEEQVAVEELNRSIEKHEEYSKSLRKQRKELEDTINKELSRSIVHQNLKDELFELVDANGKYQKSDEDRVKFILGELSQAYGVEYKLIDGQIQKWDSLKSSIEEVINAKKAEIILSYKQESYYKALENENKLYKELKDNSKNLTDAKINLRNAQDKYRQALETSNPAIMGGQVAINKAKKAVDEAENSFNKASETYKKSAEDYKNNCTDIQNYEELLKASTEKNYTEIENIMNRTSEETYNVWANNLYNQTKDIDPKNGKIGKNLVAQWASLGMTNEKKFMEEISKLDPDLQQRIIDKMEDKGFKITSNLAKGLKKNDLKVDVKTEIVKPKDTTIKIKADTTEAENKTNNWLKKLINNIPILGISGKETGGIFTNGKWSNIPQYANGGMPSHGSMFIAGEHGAEIVGHVNGRTEVLNQSQIASAIYSAVVSAMSQFSGQTNQIDVHVHTDEGTIVDRINQKTKQTGICPINI